MCSKLRILIFYATKIEKIIKTLILIKYILLNIFSSKFHSCLISVTTEYLPLKIDKNLVH